METTLKLTLVGLLLAIAACESDGPAERAGERIDDAVESLGERAEDARDEAREFVEETAERLDDAANR